MKKRIFIVVLTLMLLITGLTLTASAAVASGTCGPNLTWVLDSDGVLTISGTGPMTDYDYSGAPWNGHKESITTVVISNGVTSIGSSAFWECVNLTLAPIPDSVTSIGGWAFYHCENLTSIVLPESVASIGNSSFAFCYSVERLEINSNFTGNHNSFHECSSLTTLHLGSGVTTFYENFLANLYALKKVTVDSGNSTYSEKDGLLLSKDGRTLLYCPVTRSGSLTVPDGVKIIGEMAFFDCRKLTSVILPEGLTTIGKEAFLHCKKLAKVDLPDSLTAIGEYAFYGCAKLASMELSLTVTALRDFAFIDSGLTDLYYEGTTAQWKQLLTTGREQLSSGVTVHCNDPEPMAPTPLPEKPPSTNNSGKLKSVGTHSKMLQIVDPIPVAFSGD